MDWEFSDFNLVKNLTQTSVVHTTQVLDQCVTVHFALLKRTLRVHVVTMELEVAERVLVAFIEESD
jgi:hypothetical protein